MNRSIQKPQRIGINLVGYATSPMGLGEDLRHAAKVFIKEGVPINVIDLKTADSSFSYSELDSYLGTTFIYPITIFFMSPFSFEGFYAQCHKDFAHTYQIGNFLWELEDFPRKWRSILDHVDEIWAPTNFVRRIYQQVGCLNVHLIPAPALPPISNSISFRSELGYDITTFIFGFMFDFHSSIERKNPLALVKAYEKCRLLVSRKQPIALLIKVHRADIPSPDFDELKRYCAGIEGVHLFEETLTAAGVVGFYNTIDAYVSLHRSEGLGRTIIEAAQMGLPTICTAYSGAVDIIQVSNVIGVPYLKTPCREGDYPNCDDSIWAEPSFEYASVLMARLVRQGRKRLKPPEDLNTHFSEKIFFERALARFHEIELLISASKQVLRWNSRPSLQ